MEPQGSKHSPKPQTERDLEIIIYNPGRLPNCFACVKGKRKCVQTTPGQPCEECAKSSTKTCSHVTGQGIPAVVEGPSCEGKAVMCKQPSDAPPRYHHQDPVTYDPAQHGDTLTSRQFPSSSWQGSSYGGAFADRELVMTGSNLSMNDYNHLNSQSNQWNYEQQGHNAKWTQEAYNTNELPYLSQRNHDPRLKLETVDDLRPGPSEPLHHFPQSGHPQLKCEALEGACLEREGEEVGEKETDTDMVDEKEAPEDKKDLKK